MDPAEVSQPVWSELSRNKTTAERVFERIKREIVVGRLKPGQRLIERELTERFKVSRTPVREALKLLVRTQLAVNTPYRGVEVRRLSLPFARNIYDLRRGIEGIAAYLAAERAGSDEIAGLELLYEEISELSHAGKRDEVMLLNNRFHMAIAEAAHNELLVSQVDELWKNVNLVRAAAWRGNQRTEGSRQEHEAILAGIAARDREAARKAVEIHIQVSWSAVESAMTAAQSVPQEQSVPHEQEER